jgi:hypothetical protein
MPCLPAETTQVTGRDTELVRHLVCKGILHIQVSKELTLLLSLNALLYLTRHIIYEEGRYMFTSLNNFRVNNGKQMPTSRVWSENMRCRTTTQTTLQHTTTLQCVHTLTSYVTAVPYSLPIAETHSQTTGQKLLRNLTAHWILKTTKSREMMARHLPDSKPINTMHDIILCDYRLLRPDTGEQELYKITDKFYQTFRIKVE